ncbi:MAG: nucleoside hydrolase [Chryseolinea sp.]
MINQSINYIAKISVTVSLPLLLATSLLILSCKPETKEMAEVAAESSKARIPVIFDTDANNELDDQHALAYLFYNQDVFDLLGITVNTTMGGGNIDSQYKEADRIMKLCQIDTIPLIKGADKNFKEISPKINNPTFDGYEAVELITRTARNNPTGKLVVIAVGKLTNMALALQKDPGLADKIRLVWLGSNYPNRGEYNLESDSASMNYVLNTNIETEFVTVRFGEPSGTAAVQLSKQDALKRLPGLGPKHTLPITGRHGGQFTNLGDYLANLFEYIHYDQGGQFRALFDMAAVAIVKNPSWAENITVPAPIMINDKFVDRPNNPHKIKVWENFKKDSIMNDFFHSLGYVEH